MFLQNLNDTKEISQLASKEIHTSGEIYLVALANWLAICFFINIIFALNFNYIHSKKKHREQLWSSIIPDAPCMEYLPTKLGHV